MPVTSEVPEPWASAMLRAGFLDGRRSDDAPSISALARAAGPTVETVRRMVHGIGEPQPGNVQAVARALGVPAERVAGWVYDAQHRLHDYEPPGEAALLDDDEREAVNRIIRLMVRGRRPSTSTEGRQEDAAPIAPLRTAARKRTNGETGRDATKRSGR